MELGDDLVAAVGRLAAQEIGIAGALGTLHATTPEGRFKNYLRRFESVEGQEALCRRAPRLETVLDQLVQQWQVDHLEVAQRALGEGFGGIIAMRRLSAGRRDGRFVRVLHTETGPTWVHKPRSLAPELAYGRVLSWLCAQGHPVLRGPEVRDRGQHGWMAYVGEARCVDESAIRRFYRRQGHHLAVFTVLAAGDLHRENLVACGEHPVFVDVETLFQSHDEGTGMLCGPTAALGEPGPLPGRLPALRYHGGDSDQISVVQEVSSRPPAHSFPVLDGRPLGARRFLREVEDGFTVTYRFIQAHRHALVGEVLAPLSTCPVRYLHRDHGAYAALLRERTHPGLLTVEGAWDDYLSVWLPTDCDADARILPFERAALEAGSVPAFQVRADSREVCTTAGDPVGVILPRSGWERSVEVLHGLGDADLARRLRLIRRASRTWRRGPLDGELPPESRTTG